jgi:hypothetical protein
MTFVPDHRSGHNRTLFLGGGNVDGNLGSPRRGSQYFSWLMSSYVLADVTWHQPVENATPKFSGHGGAVRMTCLPRNPIAKTDSLDRTNTRRAPI